MTASVWKILVFFFFSFLISKSVLAQEEIIGDLEIDDLNVHLSSNYNYILNNKDLYDIGCDQIIVMKGYVDEAFLGGYRGVKYFYNEWILYRNEKAIDTLTDEAYKPAKGWWYHDDAFFNVFPYAGVYKIKLNVRAFVTGDKEDDWVIQTTESNLITVYNAFLPHLIGGKKVEHVHKYNSAREVVLDCSGASCILEYFLIVTEYDDDWNEGGKVMEKIYHGNPEDFIDLHTIARKDRVELKSGTNYKVLVGPGSNITIDPDTWYTHEAFRIE